jgi:radical SAM protein with 4Fe4S-binding SPASM domain
MRALEFTTSISNCLSCTFCPQEKLGAAYHSDKRMMTMEDFHTILNKLPKDVQIDFSGFAECFLNPNTPEMIASAVDSAFHVVLYTTLIGLRSPGLEVLKQFRPHFVKIHVPDGKALVLNEEKWVEQHELFLMAKIPAQYMAMGQPSDFIKRHLAIKGIPLELPDMLSRGGNLAHIPVRDITGQPMHCTMNRWTQNVVLPNGDVYGCCMDYSLSVYLGNLLRQPYKEIEWEAEKWKMATMKKAEGICATCEWATPA